MDHVGAEMLTGDAGHTTWTWHSPKPTAHAIPCGGIPLSLFYVGLSVGGPL